MAGASGLTKLFTDIKFKRTLEKGPREDYKKLSPDKQEEWRNSKVPPAELNYEKASRVDDGTPVHPSDYKNQVNDPAHAEVKDVGNHAKAQIKEDTVSLSRKNSSSSSLSGKTAVEQPVGRTLQFKQRLQKAFDRSAQKIGFKKKEAAKAEQKTLKEETTTSWADKNLNSTQRTQFNKLSQIEQKKWQSSGAISQSPIQWGKQNLTKIELDLFKRMPIGDRKAWSVSGQAPERYNNYLNSMTHDNFPNKHLYDQKDLDELIAKRGENANRKNFHSDEYRAAKYRQNETVINGYVAEVGRTKGAGSESSMKANEVWHDKNSTQLGELEFGPSLSRELVKADSRFKEPQISEPKVSANNPWDNPDGKNELNISPYEAETASTLSERNSIASTYKETQMGQTPEQKSLEDNNPSSQTTHRKIPVESRFKEDLPEVQQPLGTSKRDSSATLGENDIKVAHPDDLIGDTHSWSNASTTTLTEQTPLLKDKGRESLSGEAAAGRMEKWKTGLNNWLSSSKKDSPATPPAITKAEQNRAWLERNSQSGFTEKDLSGTKGNKFDADYDGTNAIGWADAR